MFYKNRNQEKPMHIKNINLFTQKYPSKKHYPFNLDIFQQTPIVKFYSPITFFIGENGTGKSTLLKAIALKCGIHIWGDAKSCYKANPYSEILYEFMKVNWTLDKVSGSYFDSELSRTFAQYLDEWAESDPDVFKYFGGKSLLTQSHGQSLMSYFTSRYKIKGVYFLDEPETALSPKNQLKLLKLFQKTGEKGHAQFIIATHSPILLACPNADIYNFDSLPLKRITYEKTQHYQTYKSFFSDRSKFLDNRSEL